MKTLTKKLIYLSVLASLALSSCSNNDNHVTPQQSNVVEVDGLYSNPMTWSSDSVYVVLNVVKIDASLTIEAGTIIKFKPEAGIEVWDNGIINAIGTQSTPIIFTSIKDDVGGDTNGDQSATQPSAGDWSNVDLIDQNGSRFEYCTFMYGGDKNYYGTLQLGSNSSTVRNCTFANNDAYISGSEFYGALEGSVAKSTCIIQNNIFYNNPVPLSIDCHISIDNSNSFSNPADAGETNTCNGIFVHGQDIISSSPTWSETDVAFVILYDNFEIWQNFHLTVGDNVVLKFLTNSILNLQYGTSQLQNYNGTGVYFTSFKDDSKKGDTNGDGNTTNPPPATDWYGIYNSDAMSFFTWANILYSSNSM